MAYNYLGLTNEVNRRLNEVELTSANFPTATGFYAHIKDAVNSFEVLRVGGLLAFDDYLWGAALPLLQTPKLAIDAFLSIYQNKIKVLVKDYQVLVQKIA
jgi:hypothetical protein